VPMVPAGRRIPVSAIFDTFKTRAEAVSAEVHSFPGKPQALGFIADLLRREGISDAPQAYAVWADGCFLTTEDRQRFAKDLPGLRFEVTRELAAEAKIGISEMEWAIADTGTVVQDASAVEKRLVSTLPSIHVAIVGTENILPDMPAVLKKVSPQQAAYLSMITGPSRTADIERVLTIGVHGPARLIIVAIGEPQGGRA
jgi:L-lactate dehydrogenase complex protein LldG